MHSMTPQSRAGFTLIELLVVMAIIATLAGLGMVGIPAILRQADKTEAKDRLQTIYKYLTIYQMDEGKWPRKGGAEFAFTLWDSGKVDHTEKDAEIFFDPSLNTGPPEDLDEMTADDIDWTGPIVEKIKAYKATMRNGHERVIVCNRVPIFQDESDLDLFPHAAKGIVYLTAAGSVDWIDAEKFGMDDPPHVVLGPESNLEMFHPIQADDDQ